VESVVEYVPPADRVLLVGEHNPHSDEPYSDLWPEPAQSAGGRLCKILRLTLRQYVASFARTNLLRTQRWSVPHARTHALRLTHRRRILLGARVAAAHGVKFRLFRVVALRAGAVADHAVWVLVLPHPSGRCRIWNDRANIKRARAAVRRFSRG
jgi:hypothetical protein